MTDRDLPSNAARVHVAAVLLAAGTSSRMGAFKQLLPFRGATIVRACVRTLRDSSVDEILVVVGHRADDMRTELAGEPVTLVENARYLEGMSTSVTAGLRAVSPSAAAVMICLCDQPHLSVGVFDALLAAYRLHRAPITVPLFGGDTGHPAIFDCSLRDEILAVDPSQGLRSVTYAHRAEVMRVPVDTVGVLDDMDTAEDYERLR